MFQGSTFVTVDGKGRLAIPTRFRDGILGRGGNSIVVTAHQYDGCLVIYPLEDWAEASRKVSGLADANPVVRNIKRRFVGQATEIEIDSAGRILIPQVLRIFARVDKSAVILGQGHRLELWSEEQWAANEEINATQIDASALPDDVQNLTF